MLGWVPERALAADLCVLPPQGLGPWRLEHDHAPFVRAGAHGACALGASRTGAPFQGRGRRLMLALLIRTTLACGCKRIRQAAPTAAQFWRTSCDLHAQGKTGTRKQHFTC